MEVLLRRDVEKLGRAGDIVNVAPGYARNYLLPKGLATTVTPENIRRIQIEREKAREEELARIESLREMAAKLAEVSVTITQKASEEGHLYGSVGPQQIAEALANEGFEVEPKMIHLDEPIKELNVYDVKVKLHPEIETTCKVWVVRE